MFNIVDKKDQDKLISAWFLEVFLRFPVQSLAALLFIALSSAQADTGRTTVFVVINGDNYNRMSDEVTHKAESMAPKVYKEIKEAALRSKNVNTVILYDPEDVTSIGPLEIHDSSVLEFITGGKVQDQEDLGETDLADPETIESMLKWGKEHAQGSTSYYFYFWGHSIPASKSAPQDLTMSFDYSSETKYGAEVLRESMLNAGFDGVQARFQAIFMSACRGNSLQILIQLGDLTDYYIGNASRLRYRGGYTRNFITSLDQGKNAEDLVHQVYDDAVEAYLEPSANPFARKAGVVKTNPQAAIFRTELMSGFRHKWAEFVDYLNFTYPDESAEIWSRSFMVETGGDVSENWVDLLILFKEWQAFLAGRHRIAGDPSAGRGIRLIAELEDFLERMILKPSFHVRVPNRYELFEQIFGHTAQDWEVTKTYGGVTLFLPQDQMTNLKSWVEIRKLREVRK